jgi:hypothetical protein
VTAPPIAIVSRSLEETKDLRWFSWDELDGLDLDPGLRRLLGKARAWMRRQHEEGGVSPA